MRAYVGQTRSKELINLLVNAGIGECCVRGELPPRRPSYFYDNGAYTDHVAERPFNITQFMRDMRALRAGGLGAKRDGRRVGVEAPAFIVLPDLVARGAESLAESESWIDECRGIAPLYLAVQDGMAEADVAQLLERRPGTIAGLFVGGSTDWKLETAASWIAWAHARKLEVHIGRVGTIERVRWARAIGADSIDSSFPLWTESRLLGFINEVAAPCAA